MAKGKNGKGCYLRGKTWWFYYSHNGTQYKESSHSTLKSDAEYLRACRIKEIREGGQLPDQQIKHLKAKVSTLANEYEALIKNQAGYPAKKVFLKAIRAEFGHLLVKELTLQQIESWQTRLLTTPRPPLKGQTEPQAPLVAASVNRRLACLLHMLTKGHEYGYLRKDQLDRLRKVKLTKNEVRRERYLTAKECQQLISVSPANLAPVIIFALNTGCRKSEILGLTWDRVDLLNKTIHLDKTKSGKPRDIPINTTLHELLKNQVRRIDSPLVFHNDDGKRWADLKRSFATACRRAKLLDFRFHDLRHTFASQLVMAGVPIASVSKLLGHATLTMTMRYAHLAPDHLQSAVEVLTQIKGNTSAANQDNQPKEETA